MNKLKILRLDLNLKQIEIAKKIGISQQAYSYIETDRMNPSLETARKISEFFKMPVEEIFFKKRDN